MTVYYIRYRISHVNIIKRSNSSGSALPAKKSLTSVLHMTIIWQSASSQCKAHFFSRKNSAISSIWFSLVCFQPVNPTWLAKSIPFRNAETFWAAVAAVAAVAAASPCARWPNLRSRAVTMSWGMGMSGLGPRAGEKSPADVMNIEEKPC